MLSSPPKEFVGKGRTRCLCTPLKGVLIRDQGALGLSIRLPRIRNRPRCSRKPGFQTDKCGPIRSWSAGNRTWNYQWTPNKFGTGPTLEFLGTFHQTCIQLCSLQVPDFKKGRRDGRSSTGAYLRTPKCIIRPGWYKLGPKEGEQIRPFGTSSCYGHAGGPKQYHILLQPENLPAILLPNPSGSKARAPEAKTLWPRASGNQEANKQSAAAVYPDP